MAPISSQNLLYPDSAKDEAQVLGIGPVRGESLVNYEVRLKTELLDTIKDKTGEKGAVE